MRDLLQRSDVEIVPVSSEAFPLPAPRPRMEALENLRLEQLGLHLMRPWRDALRDYLHTELTVAASGVSR
jgi:dTDP-4-dehydrorhamnose reductase